MFLCTVGHLINWICSSPSQHRQTREDWPSPQPSAICQETVSRRNEAGSGYNALVSALRFPRCIWSHFYSYYICNQRLRLSSWNLGKFPLIHLHLDTMKMSWAVSLYTFHVQNHVQNHFPFISFSFSCRSLSEAMIY